MQGVKRLLAVCLAAGVVMAASAGGGNYLIVAAEGYNNSTGLNNLIALRNGTGFNVTLYLVPSGTSNTTIKETIQESWGTPDAPDYIVLVGDTSGSTSDTYTIPHWSGGATKHATTDLPYACMDPGDDWYPDVFIGRLSATDPDMLEYIVDKIMVVESGIYPNPDYVRRAALLATNDTGSGAEETHNWVIANYLDPAEFESVKIYARLGGNTSDVTNAVNEGCLFTVYFGHSGSEGWWAPSFEQGNVNALDNENLYGLVFGFSCSTTHFEYPECYAETWQRAIGKGAAAYISASTFIYYGGDQWESSRRLEKYFFESFFVDDIWEVGPAWQAGIYRLINDTYFTEDVRRNMAEMFNLMGDPALYLPGGHGFKMVATPATQDLCLPGDDEAVYTIQVKPVGEFAETVTLSAKSLPAGAAAQFSVNGQVPPFTTVLTVSDLSMAPAGEYDVEVRGTSASRQRSAFVGLNLSNDLPGTVTLVSPGNGETNVTLAPELVWNAASGALEYYVEVAADSSFTYILDAAGGPGTSHRVGVALEPLRTYYWHVRAENGCGDGEFSETFSFTTRDTPSILLVDDDDNNPDVRSYYTTALATLGYDYDLWDTNNSDNEPSAIELAPYEVVIWFTGVEYGGAAGPGAAGEMALATYLDSGRCLFISGQDYYYDRGLTNFMSTYLGVSSATSDVSQTTVTGTGSVFGGMGPYSLSYPFSNYSDTINADPDAEVAFTGNAGNAAVNKDTGAYRTTFWGFPFEALPTAEARATMLEHILDWFQPEQAIGDLNCDGAIDNFDVNAFIKALTATPPDYLEYYAAYPGCNRMLADVNGDGNVDNFDIGPFVDLLLPPP
ncbi:MAG: C25 family cysteine peptidase [Phycisphaerae bacterium]|jgi:hypothetical protein